MSALERAAARALTRFAALVDPPIVVTGRDPGPAAGFLEAAPRRRMVAPAGVRVAVAAGAASLGRPTIAVLDEERGAEAGPWGLGGPLVALTGLAEVAAAARRGGARVLQPVWPEDVGVLLGGALEGDRPWLLWLHSADVGPRGHDVDAPAPGRVRVLARGEAATAVSVGPLGAPLAAAAAALRRRGVEVTAVDLVTLPGAGLAPEEAASGLLVGPGPRAVGRAPEDVAGRDDLRWVAVERSDADAVGAALLGALRQMGEGATD